MNFSSTAFSFKGNNMIYVMYYYIRRGQISIHINTFDNVNKQVKQQNMILQIFIIYLQYSLAMIIPISHKLHIFIYYNIIQIKAHFENLQMLE